MTPAEFSAWLRSQGLPLGPLAGPLWYFQRAGGKLHTHRACKKVRYDRRSTLMSVSLTADEVSAGDMCAECGDRMPDPARFWEAACQKIAAGRLALKRLPVAGPCPRDVVIELDEIRWGLHTTANLLGMGQREELDPHIAEITDRLWRARQRLAARVPDDSDLVATQARSLGLLTVDDDPRAPHVVALSDAYRSRRTVGRDGGPFSVAALYHRLDPIVDEDSYVGFGLASAALAAVFTHTTTGRYDLRAWDLGPSQPGDTLDTLRTATTVATTLSSRRQSPDVARTVLRDALTVARGVHQTAA